MIAEGAVEIVQDPSIVEENSFQYAGKYFKRFDKESCTFVSNIREQYPDD